MQKKNMEESAMSVKNHLPKLLQEESAKVFLEALLGRSIEGFKRISRGEDMSEVFASCGVCPDLYIEDLSGSRYVIIGLEKGEEKLELMSRALQSAIDVEFVDRGGSIGDLPESYIIFVCGYDYYHAGLAMYQIQNSFSGVIVDDGCHTIFLNSQYNNPNAAPQVIDFLDRVRD